ncbi:MAG: GNAT family N-acetyltransferase [Prolixibacteraceae bacterium]
MTGLQFIPVTSEKDERLEPLLKLYADSFPFEERRSEDQLKGMIGHDKMSLIGLHAGEQLVGFLIWWDFVSFGYIEHLAIFPELRGRNTGAEALKQIRTKAPKTLLEAEKPDNKMSERRIGFYRRNGFDVVEPHYLQPPYRKGGIPISMYLLSDFPHWNTEELEAAVHLIRKEVYFSTYC